MKYFPSGNIVFQPNIFSSFCAHFCPLANVLRGVQAIIIRSRLSLLLSPQELGSAFAFLEVLVSLVPFAVAPVSTSLYNYTIDFLPGQYILLLDFTGHRD